MNEKRVVITGYSALLPGVESKESLVSFLLEEKNRFTKKLDFLGGEEQEFFSSEIKEKAFYKQAKSISEDERLVKFSKKLIDNIKDQEDMKNMSDEKLGLSFATSVAGSIHVENFIRGGLECESLREMNLFAEKVSYYANAKTQNVNICACAAGTMALGIGFDMIKNGENDVVFCIAAESLSAVTFQGFKSLKAMSHNGCKPLTQERDGMTLGEGAAIVVIEEYESARKRGARIYAEVLGYGISNDAYHISAPDPEGGGAVRAMEMALEEAKISPKEIKYINIHGTGTIFNDAMEGVALKKVFGDALQNISISSTKGITGHCLAATGLIEIVLIMTLLDQHILPGNYNTKGNKIDENFDFLHILRKNMKKKIDVFMSNSFAFGGNTVSIIARLIEEEK